MTRDPRHRLRWHLRGERAMGLAFVPAPRASFALSRDAERSADASRHDVASHRAEVAQRDADRQSFFESPAPQVRPAAPSRPTPAARSIPAAPLPPIETQTLITEGPFTSPVLSATDKSAALQQLDEQQVKGCTKCALCQTRTQTVFGEGNADARLMFVGEGPGFNEDKTGRPFVGKAGQKLDDMIRAMSLTRDDVYICNVVKCRAFLAGPPAKDRPPQPQEAAACMPYLTKQIEIVRPSVIVTLGLSAMQQLLGVNQSMTRMRGQWQQWRGIPVMPTFHPSYILRVYTPETRRAVWQDLQNVASELGIKLPSSGKSG